MREVDAEVVEEVRRIGEFRSARGALIDLADGFDAGVGRRLGGEIGDVVAQGVRHDLREVDGGAVAEEVGLVLVVDVDEVGGAARRGRHEGGHQGKGAVQDVRLRRQGARRAARRHVGGEEADVDGAVAVRQTDAGTVGARPARGAIRIADRDAGQVLRNVDAREVAKVDLGVAFLIGVPARDVEDADGAIAGEGVDEGERRGVALLADVDDARGGEVAGEHVPLESHAARGRGCPRGVELDDADAPFGDAADEEASAVGIDEQGCRGSDAA